jgi:hypothetical protein
MIAAQRARGTKLVVIDPCRTATAEKAHPQRGTPCVATRILARNPAARF